MAEYHGHTDGTVISAISGAFMGILLQIQNPSGNDFIFRAAIGGVVGGAAGWGIKNLLDWLKKKLTKKDPHVKYKRK